MSINTDWMQDPSLSGISAMKLNFLQNMLFESQKYTGKEMLPFFMSLETKDVKS